ncbi:sodium-dependent bicarbonate transport family permease [Nitrosomonas sp.]|uniref:sodium-dependent bicarbonate transport family permease n=1 Tax=Nitrosomonas sp. TaxID=42353 RepID=UPI001DA5FEB3|nr:sodium-dependent bicarbonate transport family permease [Nitrosomonas sp.]MBX3617619.1 sodium-dependent bicarbonate transport family permease [Nitrosomonas sp.]
MATIQPVVFFFVAGVLAGVIKSDLKIPEALYKSLSLFLLIAIGFKGGVSMAKYEIMEVLPIAVSMVVLSALIPLSAYPILRFIGKFSQADAGAISAHYGSVSAVTFAVGVAFLGTMNEPSEGYMVLIMALMEIPALVTGTILARAGAGGEKTQWGKLMHEILTGTSLYLLIVGVLIGYYAGVVKLVSPLDKMFMDLFMGVLAFFLLEMGLLAAARLKAVIDKGIFIVAFGILFPLTAGLFGAYLGWIFGLSEGGTMLLAVLYASCSYIAAPAAMRIAVPDADPALSIGASLGVTFPFNIFIGVPIYWEMAHWFHGIAV